MVWSEKCRRMLVRGYFHGRVWCGHGFGGLMVSFCPMEYGVWSRVIDIGFYTLLLLYSKFDIRDMQKRDLILLYQ